MIDEEIVGMFMVSAYKIY